MTGFTPISGKRVARQVAKDDECELMVFHHTGGERFAAPTSKDIALVYEDAHIRILSWFDISATPWSGRTVYRVDIYNG